MYDSGEFSEHGPDVTICPPAIFFPTITFLGMRKVFWSTFYIIACWYIPLESFQWALWYEWVNFDLILSASYVYPYESGKIAKWCFKSIINISKSHKINLHVWFILSVKILSKLFKHKGLEFLEGNFFFSRHLLVNAHLNFPNHKPNQDMF